MRYLLLTTLILSFLAPVWAGDPGDQFWALEEIRKADAKLDLEISDVAKRLNANKITAQIAANEWESLLWLANKHQKQVAKLQGDAWPQAAKMMAELMRLQKARATALMEAARLEHAKGMSAAKSAWDSQRTIYSRYQTQKKKVAAEFRYIEENP